MVRAGARELCARRAVALEGSLIIAGSAKRDGCARMTTKCSNERRKEKDR
jgi:hypothetical protein